MYRHSVLLAHRILLALNHLPRLQNRLSLLRAQLHATRGQVDGNWSSSDAFCIHLLLLEVLAILLELLLLLKLPDHPGILVVDGSTCLEELAAGSVPFLAVRPMRPLSVHRSVERVGRADAGKQLRLLLLREVSSRSERIRLRMFQIRAIHHVLNSF